MDIAIVTGAETPLGLRLIERLIQQGCRVHGIGNNLSNVGFADRNFVGHAVDLTDLDALQSTAGQIIEAENRVDILIHAIDVTPGGAFENLPVGNLEAILKIGLLGPVMLTRLLLPNLIRFRGHLIHLIPSNKSGNPASAANALVEGGLREMNHALFDRARDTGLRMTNLILKQNTALPPAEASDLQLAQSRIDPAHVARVVEQLLDEHAANVPEEVTLHPRLSPEAETALPATSLPVDPYTTVALPPKEYCPPETEPIPSEKPQKVERLIPYTDEEMEDKIAAAIEDYEAHPERYAEDLQADKPAPRKSRPSASKPADKDRHDDPSQRQGKRRRRRGGRNRNKTREDENPQADPSGPKEDNNHSKVERPDPSSGKTHNTKPADATPREQTDGPAQGSPHSASPEINEKPSGETEKSSDKKPTASDEQQSSSGSDEPLLPVTSAEPTPTPEARKAREPVKKKAAKKKTAKKATKKAAKKKVAKKVAKKAAKKAKPKNEGT